MLLGKGTPANDMIGEGLIGRFELNDAWHFGVALDSVTFDYETPNRALGIPATTVVDGINEWQPHRACSSSGASTASGAGIGTGWRGSA